MFEQEMTPKVQARLDSQTLELSDIEAKRKTLSTEIRRHRKPLKLLAGKTSKSRLRSGGGGGRHTASL